MMGNIYFLPDYGILPNNKTDCSAKLQELFDTVEDGATVHFKTGEYYISDIVSIRNKSNINIFGNRSKIVTHYEPCGPKESSNNLFHLIECFNIEINGFFVDTDNPIGATGEVIGIDFDNNTVDVKVYDEFPVTGYEHICGTNSFDENGAPDYILATYNNELLKQEKALSDGTVCERLVGTDYDVVGEHTVRLKLGQLPPKDEYRLKIGHKINFRYEMYGHSVFTFAFCHRVLIKDVVIHSAASFGITIEPRSSDFTLDNFSIRVNDGSRRLKAINADGIHILGLYGKFEMKNCNIEGLGDDTLNIHGLATAVTEIEGNKLKMIGRENSLYRAIKECTWAACGDTIDIYDPTTFLKVGEFTVNEQLADGTIIFSELDGEIEKGSILANKTFYASLHLDGCVLRNTRARGILVQTQDVLIENCYICGMSYAAMLFAPDIDFWWEVGPTKNVEIRNNIIEYCCVAKSNGNKGAVAFKASHDGVDTAYPAGVHDSIYIHNNFFKDIKSSAIFVSAAKNIRIKDNEFNNCCYGASETSCEYADYDIVAINCEDIEISGNRTNRDEKKLCFIG